MDVKPSETKRRKWSWTPLQIERSDRVMEVVADLKPYWPLTLRQIYYQLVAHGHIENKLSKYILLSRLVKWMRIDGILSWKALYDGNRRVTTKRGFESLENFVLQEAYYFLDGYEKRKSELIKLNLPSRDYQKRIASLAAEIIGHAPIWCVYQKQCTVLANRGDSDSGLLGDVDIVNLMFVNNPVVLAPSLLTERSNS